jgi:hypothetical protein
MMPSLSRHIHFYKRDCASSQHQLHRRSRQQPTRMQKGDRSYLPKALTTECLLRKLHSYWRSRIAATSTGQAIFLCRPSTTFCMTEEHSCSVDGVNLGNSAGGADDFGRGSGPLKLTIQNKERQPCNWKTTLIS